MQIAGHFEIQCGVNDDVLLVGSVYGHPLQVLQCGMPETGVDGWTPCRTRGMQDLEVYRRRGSVRGRAIAPRSVGRCDG